MRLRSKSVAAHRKHVESAPSAAPTEMARRCGNQLIALYQQGGSAERIASLEAELTEHMGGDPDVVPALREFALRGCAEVKFSCDDESMALTNNTTGSNDAPDN